MSYQALNLGTVANDGTGDPLRTGGQKINENFEELYLHIDSPTTVSTAGATITLDFALAGVGNLFKRKFTGSAVIDGNRNIALDNDGNAVELTFFFEVDDLHVFTFPAEFIMSDVRWDSGANTFTPLDIGKYKAKAEFDGSNWFLEISQSIFV